MMVIEKMFLSPSFAEYLDANGLEIETLRHFDDGTAEMILVPIEGDEAEAECEPE